MARTPDEALNPHERAEAVTRRILVGLTDTLESNVAGARTGLDSECLHDLRVATRRVRSALGQIRDVLPAGAVREYRERFAWLQRVTGPVRDLDVYLLAFDDYRDSLPAPLRPGLEPLRDLLILDRERERKVLAEILDSSAFHSFMRDWRAFLMSPVTGDGDGTAVNAGLPIKVVADARIHRLARRVRREGRAIGPESPAIQLHELRKSAKKLRYLMEFFASLYPEGEIRMLIKELKRLLDQLGAYQDLSVQAGHLQEMAARLGLESRSPVPTLLAMGALIGDLLRRQRLARDGVAEVFAGFLEPDQWRCYKALFRSSAAHDEGARTAWPGTPASQG